MKYVIIGIIIVIIAVGIILYTKSQKKVAMSPEIRTQRWLSRNASLREPHKYIFI